jgi:Amt family ammonium transporter
LFASTIVNQAGADGLLRGNPTLLGLQGLGILATAAYSFGMTALLFKIIHPIAGMRVEADDEITGLDLTQHGERGYTT